MEGKTGRTKGKENTCRTVGITKALADSGHSTARKGFFYFFALKFGYSTETKNPNASPIRKVFGLFVCGRNEVIRTPDLLVPNQAHYQAVLHPDADIFSAQIIITQTGGFVNSFFAFPIYKNIGIML